MSNSDLILAISNDGVPIKAKDCLGFLANKDKSKLADFIYDRFYGRYLKPFDFSNQEYIENYKNGFLIMASNCLLIETYVSFTASKYRKTSGQSGECFGYFFTTEARFKELATDGVRADGKLKSSKEGGLPNDFYSNVRCGILHNAETRNGWIITRDSNKPYFNPKSKELNATKFSNRLKAVLKDYSNNLKKSDFDSDAIWINFKNRLSDLIQNS